MQTMLLYPYLVLTIGIVAEVMATLSLKVASAENRLVFLVPVALGYLCSFAALSLALKVLPVGNVYAIWAGCGVAGVALAGVFIWHEAFGMREILGFCAIIGGVVLLSK